MSIENYTPNYYEALWYHWKFLKLIFIFTWQNLPICAILNMFFERGQTQTAERFTKYKWYRIGQNSLVKTGWLHLYIGVRSKTLLVVKLTLIVSIRNEVSSLLIISLKRNRVGVYSPYWQGNPKPTVFYIIL